MFILVQYYLSTKPDNKIYGTCHNMTIRILLYANYRISIATNYDSIKS